MKPPRAELITLVILVLACLALMVPARDQAEPVAVVGLPEKPEAIAVAGQYAFVAVGSAGVQVFDLKAAADSGEVASIQLAGITPHAMIAVGPHLVIAAGEAGMKIVDISNPRDPRDAVAVSIPGPANDVAVKGGLAYVAGGRSGLWVVDLDSLTAVGHLRMPGEAMAVAVRGFRVFVAAGDYGLRIVDVVDPTAPVEVAACFLPGSTAVDVASSGSRAYVAGGHGGLRVVDVSRPSSPVEVDNSFAIEARSVALSGNQLLVAAADDGLHVYDRNYAQLVGPARQIETRGRATGVVAASGFAFVIGDLDVFEVFDVGGDEIFSDGFEFGDASAWSVFFPPDGWIDCRLLTIADLREGGTSQIATITNRADVEVEIVRTVSTFPSWLPDSPMYVDYFSVTEDSHFTAYWDGTGYSPVDVETHEIDFSGVDPMSSTTWYVDFDGSGTWPQYWDGTFEVCLDFRVVGTDFVCADICTSETWISTEPTYTPTPTVTPTRIPPPTVTPTVPPPTPTPSGAGSRS